MQQLLGAKGFDEQILVIHIEQIDAVAFELVVALTFAGILELNDSIVFMSPKIVPDCLPLPDRIPFLASQKDRYAPDGQMINY